MLIYKMLGKKCQASTEIECYLFISEMSQAIILVQDEIHNGKALRKNLQLIRVVFDALAEAKQELRSAIKKLTQFGVANPILHEGSMTDTYSSDYSNWLDWWEKYLGSLNNIEYEELLKSVINGDDLSEWYPENPRQ